MRGGEEEKEVSKYVGRSQRRFLSGMFSRRDSRPRNIADTRGPRMMHCSACTMNAVKGEGTESSIASQVARCCTLCRGLTNSCACARDALEVLLVHSSCLLASSDPTPCSRSALPPPYLTLLLNQLMASTRGLSSSSLRILNGPDCLPSFDMRGVTTASWTFFPLSPSRPV